MYLSASSRNRDNDNRRRRYERYQQYNENYGENDYEYENNTAEDYHVNTNIIQHSLERGHKVLVEVVSFGPLGATVHVVAPSHSPKDLPPEEEEWPILATGLIPQKELAYFRDARNNMEVVLGEILPGYVERVRDTDYKVAIGLRAFGGKQKAKDIGQQIMQLLEENGKLELGDKSSPEAIATTFPGVSKSSFKKALSALYKQGIIDKPQAQEVQLMPKQQSKGGGGGNQKNKQTGRKYT